MTYALAAALLLTVAGFLVLLDRKDARDRAERAVLLQRTQAPEAAVYEHATHTLDPDGSNLPMTDEELADREERARVLQFVERFEGVA